VKERATFHGSLRKSPKPTPADLVEEKDTHTSPRKAEKPERQTAQGVESKLVSKLKVAEKSEDQGRVLGRKGDATIVKTTPTDTPTTASPDSHIPKTVSPVLPDDDEACLLCDRPVDVRIESCGHSALCRSHANTAKRCPQCRVCVDL
jgi:DNA replication initiation complex subunit (GINS family)